MNAATQVERIPEGFCSEKSSFQIKCQFVESKRMDRSTVFFNEFRYGYKDYPKCKSGRFCCWLRVFNCFKFSLSALQTLESWGKENIETYLKIESLILTVNENAILRMSCLSKFLRSCVILCPVVICNNYQIKYVRLLIYFCFQVSFHAD